MKTAKRPIKYYTNKGFTLIELLVVISIIALLLAILMPALRKAKKQVMRSVCASNLHQYSIGIHSYAADNDGVVMSTPMFGNNDTIPFPDHWFAKIPTKGQNSDRSDNFSVEAVSQYIEAFRWGPPGWWDMLDKPDVRDHLYAEDVSVCPSVDRSFFNALVNSYYQSWGDQDPEIGQGHIQFCYAYYARVDRWKAGAMNKAREELTGNSLSSGRIIMADSIRHKPASVGRNWAYNHGKYGWATQFTNAPGSYADVGEPELMGINQMYGDGHIEWKHDSEMNTPLLGQRRFKGGYVDAGNGSRELTWFYASQSAFTKMTRFNP